MRVKGITRPCQTCGRLFRAQHCDLLRGRDRFCSRACFNETLFARFPEHFWAQVRRTDDLFSCWEWQGCKDNKGYGQTCRHGKPISAHRAAWVLTYGAIPARLCVLHHCDHPACVRPDHLFLGTKGDNNRDAAAKGRSRGGCVGSPGEKNPRARLTWEQVREIRARFAAGGITRSALAAEYPASYATISQIIQGRIWKEDPHNL